MTRSGCIGMSGASAQGALTPVERNVARASRAPASDAKGSEDPHAGAVNLALHARVTSNNHIYEFTADKAVDGEIRTYWEGAAKSYPNDITLDLGTAHAIAALRLKLSPQAVWQARTQAFTVLTSTDGESWTPLVPSAGYLLDPAENQNTVTVPISITTRYLRLSFTSNDGATGAQIAEWEVFEK